MNKDERIKELEKVALELYDMIFEPCNEKQNKIRANNLYDTIMPKQYLN
jgi:hypothetical protein